jgi:hypothetical protein
MALTPQQEKFAQGVASGLSQSDAYRAAYPKSVGWKADSVHQAASKLIADTKVSPRVAELRDALASKQLWTREQSVAVLCKVIAESDKGTDHIAAVKELNAMHGYNAAQKLDLTSGGDPLRVNIGFVD